MILDKNEILDKYNREKGKLILEFENSRYSEYISIINNTIEYKNILESIPIGYSNLEKVYYIYTNLGKILYENNNLVYNHLKNIHIYYDVIKPAGIGNCRQMSELFVSMLLYKNLINKFYLVRKPVAIEDVELRHIDCILEIDGKLYMFNIIRDTVNLRAKIRTSKFRIPRYR